jgi:hypothetical protein
MFKIVKNRTAWRTVTFNVADEEGGGASEASIDIKFRLISADELAALPVKVTDVIAASDSNSMAIARTLDHIIDDWRGPVGDDDKPLAFSVEALAVVINHVDGFAAAVRDEYHRARLGEAQIRLGNSSGSLAAGQAQEVRLQ